MICSGGMTSVQCDECPMEAIPMLVSHRVRSVQLQRNGGASHVPPLLRVVHRRGEHGRHSGIRRDRTGRRSRVLHTEYETPAPRHPLRGAVRAMTRALEWGQFETSYAHIPRGRRDASLRRSARPSNKDTESASSNSAPSDTTTKDAYERQIVSCRLSFSSARCGRAHSRC